MSDPHVAEWIEDRPALPAWADPDRMDRGTAFFAEWGVELGLGLFLSSLPLAYAAHDGVQVLALTSQLETNTKRRVLESAQFVLDVTTPGGLFPGNEPYDTVRLVRLMHAGVRNLVLTDPRIEHTSDESVWPRWDDAWGAPINQEHLLGAMISYSSSLLHVLDRLHVDYDATGASDYCHLWNVVGWLLGIDPAVLPLERAEMDDLELLIRARNERWSQAGTDMTKALLELVRSFIRIPPLRGLAVSTTRLFIGDDTAKLLEVPPADWTGRLVGGMRTMSGRTSWLVAHDRVVRALASGFSRRVLTGFVTHERHGARPSFTVPEHLAQLANDLLLLGNYAQARELQEEMLSRQRRILGDNHPDTLTSANALGLMWWVWVTISRPGSSITTPLPEAGKSSARTTPIPSSGQPTRPGPVVIG